MLCCGRRKDQGRDIPPNAEPAASPRRLQLGQLASTLGPGGGRAGTVPANVNAGKEFPHMVLQPDFRKVSGISTEIFRQLEQIENDHDATTAAALGAVERRGEMLVRILDPRTFSRPAQVNVQKLLGMQDALHSVHFVEIVKRPGQTLGLYIREGNGLDRFDGVFVSRIAIESAVFNSGCLGVGDEILAVNLVDVTRMSLDDVVILMSIPRRLVLTIRQRKGSRGMGSGHPTNSMMRQGGGPHHQPPVVVMKKDYEGDEEGRTENGYLPPGLRPHHPGYYQQQGGGQQPQQHHHQQQQQQHVNHYANLPMPSLGRSTSSRTNTLTGGTSVPRLFSAPPGIRPPPESHSIQSLSRHGAYQPTYSNLGLNYPDVTDYGRTGGGARRDDFRLDAPQPPIRRPQFPDLFDPLRVDGPPSSSRPSSRAGLPYGSTGPPSTGSGLYGPFSSGSYEWRSSRDAGMDRDRTPGATMMNSHSHHGGPGPAESLHRSHYAETGRDRDGPSSVSGSYQPPPPVITEQPRSRSVGPTHFQPFDRQYPKTLESLAEKVHTFYTGPRPSRQNGAAHSRNSLRMPRTGSEHRLSFGRGSSGGGGGGGVDWYGSMPRPGRGGASAGDFRQSLSIHQQQQHPSTPSGRYSSQGARLSVPGSGGGSRGRKPVLDYASDSEAMAYTPTSTRSSIGGLGLSASTRRSLGLTNGRSNSLPRDFIRGRGGRKPNVRFDRRGVPDASASMRARRALFGSMSGDESDGATSQMPSRRDRGIPGRLGGSSSAMFTSEEYRAWLTRAPSTSAIYERLKTNRDSDLLRTQQAAKLTFSAENLSLLDRARNRTERYKEILSETGTGDSNDPETNLALWEARLKTQEQPYYSYRSHVIATGLTGGDSTLARALAGSRPATSASLNLGSMGLDHHRHQSPSTRELLSKSELVSSMMMSPSGGGGGISRSAADDALRRLGLTPSRSRDLISSSLGTAGIVSTTSTGGITIDPTGGGRTTPTAALLQRISASSSEKETDSILRKELLARSLMGGRGITTAGESLLAQSANIGPSSTIIREALAEKLDGKPARTPTESDLRASIAIATDLRANLTSAELRLGVSSSTTTSSLPSRSPLAASSLTATNLAGSTLGSSSASVTSDSSSRSKLLTINPSEFMRYKIERPSSADSETGGGRGTTPTTNGHPVTGHSGILRVHLLAGRALRSTVRTSDSSSRTRDLYCVLECDRVHKARTVVCTGDQNFDWDEVFELDIVNNKELDFLIYSWDPQLRHRLCYKGSVNLSQVLADKVLGNSVHQLAIKVEPRGTLYVKLRHTPPEDAFRRDNRPGAIFGGDVSSIVMTEESGLNVPLIVQRCIEEIERRGLDIIGLYRLCGSATKKQTLREAFERNPRIVDLSAENVPDINVIAGVLRDYLRELPAPLLTKSLYHMLIDALSVCLPDDPEGNARLLFSIIECLPKPNRSTLLLILEHLSLVCSLSDRNKMGPVQLAGSFGPILMLHYDGTTDSLDFQPTIKVLQYLLEVWPSKSVHLLQTVRAAGAEAVRKGPSLLGKGRPFPRSSPASILSPKSQRTSSTAAANNSTSLQLSPSKQSPGSLSESSPSPTSIYSPAAASGRNEFPLAPSKLTTGTSSSAMSAISGSVSATSATTTTTSNNNAAYHHQPQEPLTPSTTSSSLTSVTTPNSLTPVSSNAKSIAPAATTSNYSLTSEFSTTSVTSPTPGHIQPSDTNEELFGSVSVRSRVCAFETPSTSTTTTASTTGQSLFGQEQQSSSTTGLALFGQDNGPGVVTTGYKDPNGEPGALSRLLTRDFAASQPAQTALKQQPPPVPPSPFMGRKLTGVPGRAERANSLDEGTPAMKRKLPALPHSFAHPDLPGGAAAGGGADTSAAQSVFQRSQSVTQAPTSSSYTQQQQSYGYTSSAASSSATDSGYSDMMYGRPSVSRTDSGSSGGADEFSYGGYGAKSTGPPPPPPKPALRQQPSQPPSSAVPRREKEVIEATPVHGSRPGSQSEEDSSTPNDDSRRSSVSSEAQSVIRQGALNGSSAAAGSNGGATASWSSSVSSSTSTPSTVQGGGGGSKGNSPGPTTPATPPPVPPRLDRRPSQTSPTSSPPSIPPPVPPRLGRTAPVRTPSLDGRENFDVDCYTITEENGEEDYLT